MLKHPFNADNLLILVNQIVSEEYAAFDYPDKYYDYPHLIRQMLTKDDKKRPDVRELLSNPKVQDMLQKIHTVQQQMVNNSGQPRREKKDKQDDSGDEYDMDDFEDYASDEDGDQLPSG